MAARSAARSRPAAAAAPSNSNAKRGAGPWLLISICAVAVLGGALLSPAVSGAALATRFKLQVAKFGDSRKATPAGREQPGEERAHWFLSPACQTPGDDSCCRVSLGDATGRARRHA